MTEKRPVETPKDLLEALDELFAHLIMNDQELADDILREAGYDPVSIGKELADVARKAAENSPFNWRNKGELLTDRVKELRDATEPTRRSRAENETALNKLWLRLENRPQNLVIAYQNRSDIPDDDFDSLVAQVSYLIEQQEKDKK